MDEMSDAHSSPGPQLSRTNLSRTSRAAPEQYPRRGGRHVQLIESRTTRVIVLSTVLLLAGLAGCTLNRPESLVGTTHIPWWAFVVIFAVTEAFVLKVRVQGQLEGVSLSEIPLAIGLFMAAEPGHVILTRM